VGRGYTFSEHAFAVALSITRLGGRARLSDIEREINLKKPIVWINNEQLMFGDIPDGQVEKTVEAHCPQSEPRV